MPSETDVLVLEQMFWIGTVVTGVQITKHSGTKDLARSSLALAGRGLYPQPLLLTCPFSPVLSPLTYSQVPNQPVQS